MKMPEPVAETTCDCYPDHIGAIYAEAFLPVGTKLYDKQALIDLLEEAAVECDQERVAHLMFKNYQAAMALADVADSIRKLKETL
jgi:hypothetical protein